MKHNEIYEKLLKTLPIDGQDVECWFPNGKNSVRVRSRCYGEFIFTYKNKKEWRMESVDSYLNSIKVEVK